MLVPEAVVVAPPVLDVLARVPVEPPDPVVAVPEPPAAAQKPGRNDPCPCGSGKKFKKCHGA